MCIPLWLTGNDIGAEGGVAIAKALEVNEVLTSLDIGGECSVLVLLLGLVLACVYSWLTDNELGAELEETIQNTLTIAVV